MQLQNYYFLQHNDKINVASVVGNLLAMLGNALYVPGRPQVPENKVVCIFHSLTLSKYKMRVMDSFKSGIPDTEELMQITASINSPSNHALVTSLCGIENYLRLKMTTG